jgi:hypothetical protein
MARVKTGAKIFRSILSADLDLASKAAEDGTLVVIVFTSGKSDLSGTATEIILGEGKPLSGHRVRVEVLSDLRKIPAHPAAVFIADDLGRDSLDALVRWQLEQKVFVFSPYEGHVERGIAAGISIGARVQPFLNKTALERTGVRFRPLVVEAAKIHGGGG